MAAGNLWVNLGLRTAAFDRGLSKSRKGIKGFEGSVRSAGKSLMGMAGIASAGAGLYTLNRVLVSSTRHFLEQMAEVSTMLDDHAMHLMPQYNKQIREMSVRMGESTSTLTRGLYDILSSGVAAAKAMRVLGTASKMAKAGVSDTAVTADALTTILNSYGKSAEQATEISDDLFATIKAGKLTMAELAPNIGKVASLAATAGVSLEDLLATTAALTQGGLKTEFAVTALRSIITSLVSPTEEAAAAAKNFGLVLDTNTLKSEGLHGIIQKLAKAELKHLEKIIPNVRGMAGLAVALQRASTAGEIYEHMLTNTGDTEEAFQKIMATSSASIDTAKQAWEDFKLSLGEKIAPPLAQLLKELKTIIDYVDDIKEANKEITEARSRDPAFHGGYGRWYLPSRIPPGMEKGPRPGTFRDPSDGRVYDIGTPMGALDMSPRTIQRIAEMRVAQRQMDRGVSVVQEYRGPFPGTEYGMNLQLMDEQKALWEAHHERFTGKYNQRMVRNAIKAHEELTAAEERARWEQVGATMEYSMTSAFDRIVWEAESWGDAMAGIARDVAREISRVMIFQRLTRSFMDMMGVPYSGAAAPTPVSTPYPVHGKGDVITGPSLGWTGEAGPEAILPLERGPGGKLGVRSSGGGAAPTIIVNNNGPGKLQVDGPPQLDAAGNWVISLICQNIENRGVLYHKTRG